MGLSTLSRLTNFLFGLFLILSLTAPSWQHGIFSWWPLYQLPTPYNYTINFGLFNLLPLLILISLVVEKWKETVIRENADKESSKNQRRPLSASPKIKNKLAARWRPHKTVLIGLILAITLLAIWRLDWSDSQLLLRFFKGLGLFYFCDWFVSRKRPFSPKRPFLLIPLALILTIQGSVGLLQFLRQSEVGLWQLGELPLDPLIEGISVLQARGQPWLRAYGLTPHPNMLAAHLTAILLLIVPRIGRLLPWQQWLLLPPITLGTITLFLTFSRAAWLAFALALTIWAYTTKLSFPRRRESTLRLIILLSALALITLSFLYLYADLAFSRLFVLNTPTEAQSIQQRLADSQTALQLIANHPWQGVGTGQYVVAAQQITPNAARVHNVLLWTAAEWGIGGFLLTLTLFLLPLFWIRQTPPHFWLPWLGMVIINQFDTTLWLFSNWQTAVLFALLITQTNQPPINTAADLLQKMNANQQIHRIYN